MKQDALDTQQLFLVPWLYMYSGGLRSPAFDAESTFIPFSSFHPKQERKFRAVYPSAIPFFTTKHSMLEPLPLGSV